MAELESGLYETIVTESLRRELATLLEDRALTRPLRSGDVADRIGRYVAALVEQVLSDMPEEERVSRSVLLANELATKIIENTEYDNIDSLIQPAEVLRAVMELNPDGAPRVLADPLVPLLDTALLTNAPGEPTLWNQLLAEIDSADQIDVVMAFIRRSGIVPLLPALRRHCESGKMLRVLTTTYTNSTEQRALDQLIDLGAEIKISYDVSSTRLHAKAWCFHRNSGFTTVFVGSSNLTFSAQVTGLEWNIRASGVRNPDVLAKFIAVFESYWESADFVSYDPDQFEEETFRQGQADGDKIVILPGLELRPEPFQERLLELVALARQQGHHRNLIVAATGTGKTVMAAVDYARLREHLPRARLLFIAHREEILNQSLATFRYAMRDASFGEKWVGNAHPKDFEHVFASIQMLNATNLTSLPVDHFDVVIVDEFHHAAAKSYLRLLNHVQPRELLGLTATPERSDGLSIFHWFDNRIAAELRLWDAIDQGRLAPFVYYGVHDGLDLTSVPWKRGQGYDVEALSQLYTSTDSWARLVVAQLLQHVDEVTTMRCLGFCVSVEHARFMAKHFNEAGVAAVAVWGTSSEAERRDALRQLADGTIRVVFSVDLFNEGIDVPNVDTILMLRPTESATLFMQQLGRGLRRSAEKTVCTVLDFVGTHRKEFRYDHRFRALIGGSRKELEKAVKSGFPYLPAGCHMQLDRQSTEIILRSLRAAVPSLWKAKVEKLREMVRASHSISLSTFLDESGLDLDDIYDGQKGHGWSALCEQAGVPTLKGGDKEEELRRAIGRMLHIDDSERLTGYRKLLLSDEPPDPDKLVVRERRLLRMLVTSLTSGALSRKASLGEGVQLLWSHDQIRAEMIELLRELERRQTHVNFELRRHPDVPLRVHGRYTRREILAAMGEGDDTLVNVPEWREGVRQAKLEGAELFAFTLDKTGDSFSPTTRYRDYAISPTLVHWESQSTTAADSPTGLRYRNHERDGRSIFLFCRLRTDDLAFWFIGPGTYRGHVGGKPMAIKWELEFPLAGDLFVEFAAAVA
jgi:superfamily II DNA or RNA helicase/HKD family nuclease